MSTIWILAVKNFMIPLIMKFLTANIQMVDIFKTIYLPSHFLRSSIPHSLQQLKLQIIRLRIPKLWRIFSTLCFHGGCVPHRTNYCSLATDAIVWEQDILGTLIYSSFLGNTWFVPHHRRIADMHDRLLFIFTVNRRRSHR